MRVITGVRREKITTTKDEGLFNKFCEDAHKHIEDYI